MINLFGNSNGILGYVAAFCGISVITGLLTLPADHINTTTVALALVLFVLIVATLFGSRPALLASVLGVLSFNFFFLPPYYTWNISASENLVAFVAFLVTAVVAGQLSSYARRRTEESEIRRKEIEKLYHQLQSAFEQASQAEALRQSEQLKSALLDAVTHDLRTPLTSIKASVTTLIEHAKTYGTQGENSLLLDSDARREFLDIINEETDRLNEFIGGMVDLARIEAGRIGVRKTLSEMSEIVIEAKERAKVRLTNHRMTLHLKPDLPSVRIDAAAVAEVIYTLLNNAAKYSPEQSEIRVGAQITEKGALQVYVDDCGQGIDPEMRERVFEKFYRNSENEIHSTASGLGLGLAIARGIVQSQGGNIWIEDGTEGFVTRVVFQIPIDDDGIVDEH